MAEQNPNKSEVNFDPSKNFMSLLSKINKNDPNYKEEDFSDIFKEKNQKEHSGSNFFPSIYGKEKKDDGPLSAAGFLKFSNNESKNSKENNKPNSFFPGSSFVNSNAQFKNPPEKTPNNSEFKVFNQFGFDKNQDVKMNNENKIKPAEFFSTGNEKMKEELKKDLFKDVFSVNQKTDSDKTEKKGEEKPNFLFGTNSSDRKKDDNPKLLFPGTDNDGKNDDKEKTNSVNSLIFPNQMEVSSDKSQNTKKDDKNDKNKSNQFFNQNTHVDGTNNKSKQNVNLLFSSNSGDKEKTAGPSLSSNGIDETEKKARELTKNTIHSIFSGEKSTDPNGNKTQNQNNEMGKNATAVQDPKVFIDSIERLFSTNASTENFSHTEKTRELSVEEIMAEAKFHFNRISPHSAANKFQNVLYESKQKEGARNLRNTSTGFADMAKWHDGVASNPDPVSLTPIMVKSFEELKERALIQNLFLKLSNARKNATEQRLKTLEVNQSSEISNALKESVNSLEQLSERLSGILASKDIMDSKRSLVGIPLEEDFSKRLYNFESALKNTAILSDKICSTWSAMKEERKNATKEEDNVSLDKTDFNNVEIEAMAGAANKTMKAVREIEKSLRESVDKLDNLEACMAELGEINHLYD